MDQEELDFQDAADDLLPKQPELPPTQDSPSPLATGKDQDAGEPREWGHSPVAPAFVPPEVIPPSGDSPKYKTEPPETIHYAAAEPSFPVDKTPPPPKDLPPIPRVRNPGRERRKRMRAAKKAEHLMSLGVSDGDMLAFNGAKEWNTSTTELNDEWTRLWSKATRAIAMNASHIAMFSKMLEDVLARQLEMERWIQTFTRDR